MQTLNHPPFPLLTWTKYDWWVGTALLPAWAGFQSRGGAYGGVDSSGPSLGTVELTVTPASPEQNKPSEHQCRAYQFQLDYGPKVVAAVLEALLTYYRGLRTDWGPDAEALKNLMPEISGMADFRALIGVSQLHVHPYFRDNLAYVGLEFGCTWDEEHGLGVMLHGARVVRIGDAAYSFAWMPDEATLPS